MSIDSGFPGKTHDSDALQQSRIWKEHEKLFGGYAIYGDAAYPLKSWLLTGYRNRNKTPDQVKFNRQGSRARVIVECAFGKLKGQWRLLAKGFDTRTPQDWKCIVTTCCILHNFTITMAGQGWRFSDKFGSKKISSDSDVMSFRSDPAGTEVPVKGTIRDCSVAKKWRDGLLAHLKSTGHI